METAYKKVGRKYVPCGVFDYPKLTNGNWLIVVNGNQSSCMNVSDGVDLSFMANVKRLKNEILNGLCAKHEPSIFWERTKSDKKSRPITDKLKAAYDAFRDAFKCSLVHCSRPSLSDAVDIAIDRLIKSGELK